MRIPRQRLDRTAWDLGSYLVLALATLFSLGPIAFMLLVSVLEEGVLVRPPDGAWHAHVTLANYVAVWQHTDLPRQVANSLVVTALTTALCLAVGVPAAYAFARLRFGGRGLGFAAQLVLRMVPTLLMLVPLFVLMRAVGLIDTHAGLALAYSGLFLPIAIILMIGALEAVPREIEEAARLDGCSRWQAMLRIVLPLARGGVGAAALIVALSAWNEYVFALVLTSGSGSRTWPVGLRLMVGDFQLPWGMLAAAGILGILPVLATVMLVLRLDPAGKAER